MSEFNSENLAVGGGGDFDFQKDSSISNHAEATPQGPLADASKAPIDESFVKVEDDGSIQPADSQFDKQHNEEVTTKDIEAIVSPNQSESQGDINQSDNLISEISEGANLVHGHDKAPPEVKEQVIEQVIESIQNKINENELMKHDPPSSEFDPPHQPESNLVDDRNAQDEAAPEDEMDREKPMEKDSLVNLLKESIPEVDKSRSVDKLIKTDEPLSVSEIFPPNNSPASPAFCDEQISPAPPCILQEEEPDVPPAADFPPVKEEVDHSLLDDFDFVPSQPPSRDLEATNKNVRSGDEFDPNSFNSSSFSFNQGVVNNEAKREENDSPILDEFHQSRETDLPPPIIPSITKSSEPEEKFAFPEVEKDDRPTTPRKSISEISALVDNRKLNQTDKKQESPFIKNVKRSFGVLNPVMNLIYWRDLKKSGVVFGCILTILMSLIYLSLISVIAYSSLVFLTGTITFRVYKNIMQAIQKSQDGHPFKEYLEFDTNLHTEKAHELTDVIVAQLNSSVSELKRLFLVEDLIDSVKFAFLLSCLTYIGAWFNGLTLIILAFVALFTLPKVYELNKTQIDQYFGLVQGHFNDVMTKVKAAIPIGNKEKAQ